MIFTKPISENKIIISLTLTRIGLAFSFFWAGYRKASNPEGIAMVLQIMVGFEPNLSVTLAFLVGVFELISGAFILAGFLFKPAALFQTAIAIGSMAMFGFDSTSRPPIWKDPTILGVSIELFL
jgi:uncharacterized membrane protein YphA (DoxX/SURF4 family)